MASTRRRYAVETSGVRQARLTLEDLGLGDALDDRLKTVHTAVAQVLVTEARRVVPHRTGRLGVSIAEVQDTKTRWPIVRAGDKTDVPYAGPIHFGWPTRGLHNDNRALLNAKGAILAGGAGTGFGLRAVTRIERRNKAVAKGRKGKVRGGPIKPQPFLYEAADRRRSEVLAAYQDGVNRIFTEALEGG